MESQYIADEKGDAEDSGESAGQDEHNPQHS
jgi:hypothetical protein